MSRAGTSAAGGGPPGEHASFHAWLRSLPGGADRIAAHAFHPARGGVVAAGVPEPYRALVGRLGLEPWRHQAEALAHLAEGRDVVLATPTASGKSLAYQLPILRILGDGGTALGLFPTKALAEDQLEALRARADAAGIDGTRSSVVRYDGDTPRGERIRLRQEARVVLTNPDMLHAAVCPFHGGWARFLARLEVVVVDELHAYRGVLGSHVGNVLRRILRLAAHYGASPRIVAASATIANPGELFAALTGRDAAVVADDAAQHGPREIVFWEPPPLPGTDGRRRSPVAEAAELAAAFAREGVKSLFFCNSRRAAELLARYAGGRLGEAAASSVDAYRAGYDAATRRDIETGFRRGDITVLAATSALELGVDVGGVDAVVLVGYPGSIMSLWQRAGRAGRGGERSLTLLVPGDDPLDEHYLRHPEALLDGSVEAAVADAHNEVIHPRHVVCAAAEDPVDPREAWLAPGLELEAVPGLVRTPAGFVATGRYPHRHVSLRGAGGGRVRLVEAASGRSLGTSDAARAMREAYVGAVHLHRGEAYLVVELDLEAGVATLLPHIEDWFTQVRGETHVEIVSSGVSTGPAGADAALGRALGVPPGVHVGRVRVTSEITGYVRKRYRTGTVLGEFVLDLPPSTYDTRAVWFATGPERRGSSPDVFAAALHALEHTMIGLLPAFVLCERADVGGVSYPLHPQLREPAIFVYDGVPGGVGYTAAGASSFLRWLAAAHERLATCPCVAGCPRCVLSPKCGNGNQFLDKEAAERLAGSLGERLARDRQGTAPSA